MVQSVLLKLGLKYVLVQQELYKRKINYIVLRQVLLLSIHVEIIQDIL